MSNFMKILSQLNEDETEFNCTSLMKAKDILEKQKVKYDNIYRLKYSDNNQWGVEKSTIGIHFYFNNGKNSNVAVYTPTTESLVINTREDGTPEDKREYIK
jgi:hypothetical protein